MIGSQFILPLAGELVVDLFAGGGGASTGIEQAIGRHVDIAINHDPQAVSLHQANHPQTQHHVSDVFEADPRTVTDGRPVGLLWASPDCTFHSKARGGKPHRDRNKARRRRGLAWVVCRWAREVRPRVIALENVEEFQHWGPLTDDGQPCPERKGLTFRRWVAQLRNLGYAVEWRELRACDYGAPTIRKRLFLVARCDGHPIVWPAATHGTGLRPYRTAAECIDWSLPCPSIFERERPLAEATLRRIAHGIKRYVLDTAEPFIVPVTHSQGANVQPATEPLRTVTTAKRGEFALVAPTFAGAGGPSYAGKPASAAAPLGTVLASDRRALVAAFLAKHFGGEPGAGKTAQDLRRPAPTVLAHGGPQAVVSAHLATYYGGHEHRGQAATAPLATQTAANRHAVVTANMVKLRGTSSSAATDEPLHTVSAGGQHHAEVRALLLKYYGSDQDPRLEEPMHTVTTRHRFGLVTVAGEAYEIADTGMRMLQPRELYRAQGFPETYIIDRGADGRPLTKEAQVRMCGNSVAPPVAAAIVKANYSEQWPARKAA